MTEFDTGKLCGAKSYRGYNQTTAYGRAFYVFDPQPSEVYIEDIAAQLSRICRFGGALRPGVDLYTVAQHCCLVSDHCPSGFKLEGLLHDAHEAYCGDLLKPIKMLLPEWKAIEGRVEAAVRRRFLLPPTVSPEVKKQDYLAVATEHRDLQICLGEVDWGPLPEPWPERIVGWSVTTARDEFLSRFYALKSIQGDEE